MPGFVAYGVMAACFNILAITLVNRREMGLLKRLRLSPLPTWVLLTAIVVSSMIIAVVEVVILLVVGRLGFDVHVPDNVGAFVVAVVVGMLSFSALGVAMSTLVPNQDAAGPIVSIVFFVLLFLSGLWFPLKPGSGLAQFSAYFPVHHFITAVFAPFNRRRVRLRGPGTTSWSLPSGVLSGAIVAVRRWEWAPRRSLVVTQTDRWKCPHGAHLHRERLEGRAVTSAEVPLVTTLSPSTYAASAPDRPAVITSSGQTVTFAEAGSSFVPAGPGAPRPGSA